MKKVSEEVAKQVVELEKEYASEITKPATKLANIFDEKDYTDNGNLRKQYVNNAEKQIEKIIQCNN